MPVKARNTNLYRDESLTAPGQRHPSEQPRTRRFPIRWCFSAKPDSLTCRTDVWWDCKFWGLSALAFLWVAPTLPSLAPFWYGRLRGPNPSKPTPNFDHFRSANIFRASWWHHLQKNQPWPEPSIGGLLPDSKAWETTTWIFVQLLWPFYHFEPKNGCLYGTLLSFLKKSVTVAFFLSFSGVLGWRQPNCARGKRRVLSPGAIVRHRSRLLSLTDCLSLISTGIFSLRLFFEMGHLRRWIWYRMCNMSDSPTRTSRISDLKLDISNVWNRINLIDLIDFESILSVFSGS